jgi:DNA-binding CsgD family transcriptional regulator
MTASNQLSPKADTADGAHLELGRECYGRRAWARAHEALSRADQVAPLGVEDLERLATAAYLIGRDAEYLTLLERAHQAHLATGERVRAARTAFWLGLRLLFRGEQARANGWRARTERLLDHEGRDCVERGYLLLLVAQQHVGTGHWDSAYADAASAVAIGERFTEPDLVATARHLQGRVRMQQGRVAEGLSLLDEAMVAVTAGELSPLVTGLIYCSVIEGCDEVYALERAREWTNVLAEWCEQQPEMVAFTGVCRVHRAAILLLNGAWSGALEEAECASERCVSVNNRLAAAAALYQQGEIRRLRGELTAAEQAYRSASEWGWEPQPGLALLRLAQTRTDAAAAAIRRVVGETTARSQRLRLLPAYIEIMLAVGDTEEARKACAELEESALSFDANVLRAMATHANGAIELAEGNALVALTLLRRACDEWQRLEAPYTAARVRVLVGLCCRTLADHDGALLEFAAARTVFERLGATPEISRIESLTRSEPAGRQHGLTSRELEVLRWVATGKGNRAIASQLFLSEKTIERHLSNIFIKLGVPSRAAATAYAYEHGLI